jgi:hypothetical protein
VDGYPKRFVVLDPFLQFSTRTVSEPGAVGVNPARGTLGPISYGDRVFGAASVRDRRWFPLNVL